MRYANVETMTFTDINGKSYPVKALREIPEYTIMGQYDRQEQEPLDAIATRSDVYGRGAEGNSFRLHEANLTAILDRRMVYELIPRIEVPE